MQCLKIKHSFCVYLWAVLFLQVNTCLVYSPSSLLAGVWPRGPRRTRLLSVPPISPAARRTVSSTIKGCAVMKGALAEAIYFPAQCRKVPLVLIFKRRLCVPYSAIMGGMRRTHPAWTNEIKRGGRRGWCQDKRPSFSILENQFSFECFFHNVLVFLFIYLLWIYVILYRYSVCGFAPFSCWVFLVCLFSSPTFASFSAPLCAPTSTSTTTLLTVIPVFILFLWSLLN